MKPSDVMLRSDTNWTRSWLPLVTMTLRGGSGRLKHGRRGRRSHWPSYPGALSPQNFPIRRELSLSPPLNNAT